MIMIREDKYYSRVILLLTELLSENIDLQQVNAHN